MEVTRKNFKETLPLVTESIEKADFLVIDAEFTGLINGRDVSVFDSPHEYYTRLLNGSTEFLLIQYGLCAFYWDEEEKRYMSDAYNFYLFPRGRPGPDKIFLCQSSSLDFLSAQGFDFNKLIKEGISYMTETTESRLRESLTERQKAYYNEKDIITIPDEHKQQIEDICKRVRQFLDENKSDELEIDRCNAFIRRLLFQELGARFKDQAFVETKILENKNRVLKVMRIKIPSEGKSRELQKREKEWEELEDAVGFSKVVRMISQSEKLVVGHNMLLDVLHTLNHFFQPLPADYETFKEFAHCMFPRLLDTKYMSSLPPFKDKVNSSVLPHLLSTLSEPPFALPETESNEGRGYSRADDKQHEAGYDAYVTGLCFLAMHAHLARMRGEPPGRVPPPDSAALKPFVNKLYLAKTAHQDSPYMNIAGSDPTPSRDHVFHLTFPKEWQRTDISQLFSPFGPIMVNFLDDTSALVALTRREQARDATRALARHHRVTLVPYARYKQPARIPEKKPSEARRDTPPSIPSADNKPDSTTIAEKVSTTCAGAGRAQQKPALPVRVERARANSLSAPPALPAHPARKRTSSGVFQIDDAEPPPKKIELVRPSFEKKKTDAMPNGRRKTAKGSEGKSGMEKTEKGADSKATEKAGEGGKVIEKFDSEAKTQCVSAFKESDSWD